MSNLLYNALQKGKTEEDIKNIFAKYFDIQYDTSDRLDLYTPQVLFEFKFDKNFENLTIRAAAIAQVLYYVRRLKYGNHPDKPISPMICVACKDQALLCPTIIWKDFYDDFANKFDWDLAPSMPDPVLIKALSESTELKTLHLYKLAQDTDFEAFKELLNLNLKNQNLGVLKADKKIISEENFENVFVYWNNIFGEQVRNGLKTSRYFVCDIQEGRTYFLKDQSKVIFNFSNEEAKVKKILLKDYEYFWSLYEKVQNPSTMRGILAKIDRLTDESLRRFHGEFFTPLAFAKKGLDYLEKTLGKTWWKSGNYRLWDMAAGTGNLEYHLPNEALPYCYLSTLYKEDLEHCQKLFPEANNFQYDYLNDDVANVFLNGSLPFDITWKLPQKLRLDLKNPDLKWIILINPPFGTSSLAGTDQKSKAGASDTNVRKMMHEQNLGEVSRELFTQFLFRIKTEFKNKVAHLGLFANLKYTNSNNDQNFRDHCFQYLFECGFVFSSANFSGTSKASAFPVCFIVWNLTQNIKIDEQKMVLDIFDEDLSKIGQKKIIITHRDQFLNKWLKRPKTTKKYPPFSSGITIKPVTKDVRNRVSENFLASLISASNDVQHQNFTAFLSGPYVSAGAFSVTPENFEKANVMHAVRRLPKMNWLNNKSIFMKPAKKLKKDFVLDCIIWNLFSTSNQTVAMRNVIYEKEKYQIHNHFFPFPISEVQTWKIADADIFMDLAKNEDRFVAKYLQNPEHLLSAQAEKLFAKGREIYQFYFANLNELRSQKFKIESFDAGWWQIRNALAEANLGKDLLEELRILHNELKNKLLPQIYEYGFLSK